MVAVVIAGLFGLVFGSFLNVVIYRFDDLLSIMTTRSHCRHCKTQLSWLDLIPLLSFVTLKGRCRYCQKPIAWQYPLVEAVTALLFATGYIHIVELELGATIFVLAFAAYILTIGTLIVIFFHDLYEMMISDYLGYFFIAVAFIYSLIIGSSLETILSGALISTLPIALLVYPSRGKWMGEGDVKLALGIGLFLGYPLALVALLTSFITGGVLGSIILMTRKATLKTAVPFAPFLIIGTTVAFLYGQSLIDWYLTVVGYGYN